MDKYIYCKHKCRLLEELIFDAKKAIRCGEDYTANRVLSHALDEIHEVLHKQGESPCP